MLGASQAGTRLRYQATPGISLIARLSTAIRRTSASEAALGIEWQLARDIPLRLLAERRQALGREGRSAFAATLHGGVSERPLPLSFRLDAYAQAGAVGLRSRDLFAEGTARIGLPIGSRGSVGAAAWGAAQPAVRRLDLGPSASLRLPTLGATLSADWRFRVAGNARPGSGPALTLWTDF